MKVSLSKLKNTKVYCCGETEPFGVFSDTLIDNGGKVVGYIVKTISIIPISKVVEVGDIMEIENGDLILLKNTVPENAEHFKNRRSGSFVCADSIKTAAYANKRIGRLRDIRFDAETGEICDVIVCKNIISGKEKISVNKIFAKDNTIYIEK